MEKLKKYSDILFLLGLTIIAFQYGVGFGKFNPTNISWLFEARNDWATHHIGWSFFRDSTWQFPLGTIDNYNYPIGTNIGFTDSIPLFAFLFKLISFLLPENFQYIGMWLFLCMFLNGYYSLKIFKYFKVDKLISFLFVIFILLNPVFIFRQVHPALCAQWLLIGSIYLYLSTDKKSNLKKAIQHHLLLLLLSCFITPYLTVVVLGFFGIFIFKLFFYDKLVNFKLGIIYIISSFILVFGSWILIGIINFSKHVDNDSTGFYGIYKLNLNSLYNPLGYSNILPEQKLVIGYQQDAFTYLGFGIIIMILVAILFSIYSFVKHKRFFFNKKLIPLCLFCVFLTIFATTHLVSFNDKNIFTIPLLDKISYLGDVFRASGRFFWSIYFLIIYYFLIIFSRIPFKKSIKIGVVSLLIIIQLYDINPIYNKIEYKEGDYKPAVNIEFWNTIFSNFKNVITVMPFNNDLVNFQDYQEIAFFAYKNRTTITNGNLARNDGDATRKFTNEVINDLIQGNFQTKNLYITSKENLKYFSSAYEDNLVNIINSDGYYFVYSSKKRMNKLQDNLPKDKDEFQIAKRENLKKSQFNLINSKMEQSKGIVTFNFDNQLITNSIIHIKGWAYVENTNNNIGDSIFIYLKNNKNLYQNKCVLNERKDITIFFKKENLDNSGFENFAFTNNLEKGKYELIVAIKDKKGDFYYSNSNKIVNIGFEEFLTPLKTDLIPVKNQNLGLGIDTFDFKDSVLQIKGWAAFKEFESKDSKIEILFIKGKEYYISETILNSRKDVTDFLKNGINYDDSGFEAKINTKPLTVGNYDIGIKITNTKNNKVSYILSDKKIKKE